MKNLRIETKGVITNIYVDDVEIKGVMEYSLSQKAGEIPILTVKLCSTGTISTDISDVFIKQISVDDLYKDEEM